MASCTWEVPVVLNLFQLASKHFYKCFIVPGRPTVDLADSFSFSQFPRVHTSDITLDSKLVP